MADTQASNPLLEDVRLTTPFDHPVPPAEIPPPAPTPFDHAASKPASNNNDDKKDDKTTGPTEHMGDYLTHNMIGKEEAVSPDQTLLAHGGDNLTDVLHGAWEDAKKGTLQTGQDLRDFGNDNLNPLRGEDKLSDTLKGAWDDTKKGMQQTARDVEEFVTRDANPTRGQDTLPEIVKGAWEDAKEGSKQTDRDFVSFLSANSPLPQALSPSLIPNPSTSTPTPTPTTAIPITNVSDPLGAPAASVSPKAPESVSTEKSRSIGDKIVNLWEEMKTNVQESIKDFEEAFPDKSASDTNQGIIGGGAIQNNVSDSSFVDMIAHAWEDAKKGVQQTEKDINDFLGDLGFSSESDTVKENRGSGPDKRES